MAIGTGAEIPGQRVDPQVALGLLGTMAAEAVLGEEGVVGLGGEGDLPTAEDDRQARQEPDDGSG